jgi:hypothetical protein
VSLQIQQTRALLAAISCVLAASVARAEPLPGDYEVVAGAHAMLLISNTCETDGDVSACQGGVLFGGFQLSGRIQLGAWFALGLRFAGSTEIDGTSTIESNAAGEIITLERDLWLWQLALQARFDPPAWPSGLWIGAEIGSAFSVDDVDEIDAAGETQSSHSLQQTLLLMAAVVGYDIALGGGFLFGLELRGQYLSLRSLPAPRQGAGTRELQPFPYVSLGVHFGVRW